MKQEKLAGLGRLNAYQIAGLSVVTSTLAALGVLFMTRRWFFHRAGMRGREAATVDAGGMSAAPDHFSEELLVPGITHTGTEILEQDSRQGRSPEGV